MSDKVPARTRPCTQACCGQALQLDPAERTYLQSSCGGATARNVILELAQRGLRIRRLVAELAEAREALRVALELLEEAEAKALQPVGPIR